MTLVVLNRNIGQSLYGTKQNRKHGPGSEVSLLTTPPSFLHFLVYQLDYSGRIFFFSTIDHAL